MSRLIILLFSVETATIILCHIISILIIYEQIIYTLLINLTAGFMLQFVDRDNRLRRNVMKFGICIPASCTADDLQVTLQKEFDTHFLPHRINAQVQVESILCSTDKDEYPYDNGYYLTR